MRAFFERRKEFLSGLSLRQVNYILVALVLTLGFVAILMSFHAMERPDAPAVSGDVPADSPETISAGDWGYRCDGECVGLQSVENDEGAVVLQAELIIKKRGEIDVPRLKMITPLGTFLPSGLRIALPEKESFVVPFQFCTGQGCFVNLDMAEDVTDALKAARDLKIAYRAPDRRIEEVSLSLMGITKTIKALKKNRKEPALSP